MLNLVVVISAYLIGSISSAIFICKLFGLPDPRSVGSKNPGATNVMRVGGKKLAFLTFLGDMLKGLIPVLLAKYLLPINPLDDVWVTTVTLAAFFSFLGHLYPVFFKFKGGKGVATLVGILIGLDFLTALSFGLVWFLIYKLRKQVSLASILGVIACIPLNYYFCERKDYLVLLIVLLIFIIYRHKRNLIDLWQGKEYSFDSQTKHKH